MRKIRFSLEKWHIEERNIYKDAFSEEPKDVIAVAIMTDTDNTGAMAESYFGDIIVSKMPLLRKQVSTLKPQKSNKKFLN